jgi:hypothetical protein
VSEEERKAFFFEKKNQKTLFPAHLDHIACVAEPAPPMDKRSLVLSFEKEHLPFLFSTRGWT